MTFKEELVPDFLLFFEKRKEQIRMQPGCIHLELLQDIHDPKIIFTYSYWQSENNLNEYRNSDFFKDTWKNTKALFESRAEAWSVKQVHKLD